MNTLLKVGMSIVASASLAGCTAFGTQATQETPAQQANPAATEASMTQPGFSFDLPQDNAETNIVWTSHSAPSLIYNFEKVSEMAESKVTEAIIKGVVTATEDHYSGQVAQRVLTVQVQESYKQEVAQVVTIVEDGGLIPYALIRDELQDHSDTELPPAGPNDYVDDRFMGAPHTEVGDQIFAFVMPARKSPHDVDVDYLPVSSVQSMFVNEGGGFTLDDTGDDPSAVFERRGTSNMPSYDQEMTGKTMTDTLIDSVGEPVE